MSDLEKRITAKLVLNDTGYTSGLKGAKEATRNANAEMKLASAGVKLYGENLESLGAVSSALGSKQSALSTQVGIYREKISSLNNKLGEFKEKQNSLNNEIGEQKEKIESLTRTYGKNSSQVKEAEEVLNSLNSELNKTEGQIENTARAMSNADRNLMRTQAELLNTEKAIKDINRSALEGNAFTRFGQSAEKAGEKIHSTGEKFSSAGNKMMGLAIPLGIVGGAAIKSSMDFETSVAKMGTIADTTQVPIGALRDQVLKLSDQTGISAISISEDAYSAMSAGQKTADSVGFVKKATDLATAGFATSAQTIDVLTSIYNAYGQTAQDVTKDSDILIQTQNIGKTTVGELAQNIGVLIPVAKEGGVQLDQIGAGLALMTKQGIQTTEAITNYKAMLSELNKTGSKSDTILKKLTGEGFEGLIKQGKSVGDIINILNQYATKNNMKLGDMFGNIRAVTGAISLAGNDGKDFNDILSQMDNSAGSTDAAFKKMSDTSEYKLRVSLNKLKNDGIRLGASLAPIITEVSNGIGHVADALGKLTPGQLKMIGDLSLAFIGLTAATKGLGVVSEGIGLVTKGVGKASGIIGKFTKVAKGVSDVAPEVASGIGSVGAAGAEAGIGLGVAEGATGGLVATLGTVALPVAAAVAGVAAVGYASYKTAKYLNEDATPAVNLYADKMKNANVQLAGAAVRYGGTVKEVAVHISESTKKAVSAYMDLDKKASSSLMNLRINSDKFTKSTKDSVIKNFTDMSKKASALTQTQRNNMVVNFKKLVSDTGTLTKKNKDEVIKQYTAMVNGTKGLTQKQKLDTIKNFKDTLTNSVAITKKQSTDLENIYKQMNAKIKSGLDKKRNDEIKSETAFFAQSNALSAKEEASALNKTRAFWENKKKASDDAEKKIISIIQNAANQHRQITNKEAQEISNLQNQMKTSAVKALSDNEVQSKVILERMKDNSTHITAQMASDNIKQLNKLRDNSINAANQECDKRIAEIIRMRDVTHSISADQANKLIADANRQKDGTVKAAEETRNEAVGKIISMNSEITQSVNTTTGNLKTKWESFCDFWKRLFFPPKQLKVITSGTGHNIPAPDQNWTGTSNFKGGFTTLHERGEELYDLPQGTRIYNHEQSEELVKQTAEKTAQKLIDNFAQTQNNNGNNPIIIKCYLDSREIGINATKQVMNNMNGRANNMQMMRGDV